MLFKIFDCEKNVVLSMELNELIARIASYNTAGVHEFELLKAFAVLARTELA